LGEPGSRRGGRTPVIHVLRIRTGTGRPAFRVGSRTPAVRGFLRVVRRRHGRGCPTSSAARIGGGRPTWGGTLVPRGEMIVADQGVGSVGQGPNLRRTWRGSENCDFDGDGGRWVCWGVGIRARASPSKVARTVCRRTYTDELVEASVEGPSNNAASWRGFGGGGVESATWRGFVAAYTFVRARAAPPIIDPDPTLLGRSTKLGSAGKGRGVNHPTRPRTSSAPSPSRGRMVGSKPRADATLPITR